MCLYVHFIILLLSRKMHTRLQTGLYSSEQASLIPGILEEFLYLYFISYFTHVS